MVAAVSTSETSLRRRQIEADLRPDGTHRRQRRLRHDGESHDRRRADAANATAYAPRPPSAARRRRAAAYHGHRPGRQSEKLLRRLGFDADMEVDRAERTFAPKPRVSATRLADDDSR